MTPFEIRQQIRSGQFTGNTSGYGQGFVQGNLAIMPKEWANDFLQFCQKNPKPCPIVGMSSQPGEFMLPDLGQDIDIRSDVPKYRIYKNGVLTEEVTDLKPYWRDDLVTFVLGCSFSFEEALIADGLEVRNITEGVNVPKHNQDFLGLWRILHQRLWQNFVPKSGRFPLEVPCHPASMLRYNRFLLHQQNAH